MNNYHAIKLAKAEIAALLANHPGITDDPEAWAMSLESETGLIELLRRLRSERLDIEALAVGCREQVSAMEARARGLEDHAAKIKDAMLELVQRAGGNVKLPEVTFYQVNRKPSLVIYDEKALPENCFELVRKRKSLTEIKALYGDEIPPGAQLSNGSVSLGERQ